MLYNEILFFRSIRRDRLWVGVESNGRRYSIRSSNACADNHLNMHQLASSVNTIQPLPVFKRLLFMQILEIEEDIWLNTERAVHAYTPDEICKTTVESCVRASGRNGPQMFANHQNVTPSSRKKPKFDHPAQVRSPRHRIPLLNYVRSCSMAL